MATLWTEANSRFQKGNTRKGREKKVAKNKSQAQSENIIAGGKKGQCCQPNCMSAKKHERESPNG